MELTWFMLLVMELTWFMLLVMELTWFMLLVMELTWFMLLVMELTWFWSGIRKQKTTSTSNNMQNSIRIVALLSVSSEYLLCSDYLRHTSSNKPTSHVVKQAYVTRRQTSLRHTLPNKPLRHTS